MRKQYPEGELEKNSCFINTYPNMRKIWPSVIAPQYLFAHTAQKMKFSIKDFFSKFSEEIRTGKLHHFLRNVNCICSHNQDQSFKAFQVLSHFPFTISIE